MYKNIIFDLGNVLLMFKPLDYLEKKIGMVKASIVERHIFKSEEWLMLDRGTITEDEAIEIIVQRNNEDEIFIRQAFKDWYEILKPLKDTVEILEKLNENGYKLFYLSNFHMKAFKAMEDKYEFFKIFSGGVVSFEEGLLKPEKEIYEKLIKKYNLTPEETIFIDDTADNVEAAEQLNIKGIRFEGAEKLIDELKKYKIL